MNKYTSLVLSVFFLAQKAFGAVETVSPELQQSLKTNAHEPGALSIIFSLIVVIGLIYLTGVIYSKLNLVGVKTIKEQLKNQDINKATVISTTQIGQGRNLHVIEIDGKRLLIGSTQNSINLIKELEFKASETKSIKSTSLNEESEKINEEILIEEQEKFDVHKKYL